MPANRAFHPLKSQPPHQLNPSAPRDVAVLIPALEPGAALEELVTHLVTAGTPAVLVVDDGSGTASADVFARLSLMTRVHLLRHATNQGKGAALKTGFAYFLEHLGHYKGLVTADADGQHGADDVLRVARALHRSPRLMILGARSFQTFWNAGIPVRNYVGNRVMKSLFRAITRLEIMDAQTGLRAIPTSLLPALATLPGSRYDFEIAMLLYVAQTRHPLAEQPITTIYAGGETQSHFRPILDSIHVLRALMRSRNAPAADAGTEAWLEAEAALNRTSSARTVRMK